MYDMQQLFVTSKESRCKMKEFIEKLIGRLEEYPHGKYEDEYGKGFSAGINASIEEVNELAEEHINTSTDTSSGWIPVSGKLPNDMERCLVTLENGYVMFATYIIDEFMSPIGHFVEGNKPIAWMPLPAPYKE